ncbi:MAG: cysteine--tRNA ligase [Parvularculaceae bacterium]
MALTLYDSMAREKRVFEPADPKRVTMYVCGPTVYSYAHIGNARSAVAFDLLYRVLRARYGADHVVYARNITDIDDKIIKASRETGEPIAAITEKFADIYRADMGALGVIRPGKEPQATKHIPQMIAMMETLIENGSAYAAEGHVLFSIDSYQDYGKLSGADREEMVAGARVEVAPYKKNPADFVLWKPSQENEPGWESPWGRGRPGWHLECSVMIESELGRTIDIHGGGQDLRFPHHENEIAQSACAHHGAPLARYWLHNGFLRMGADKMSKSLGNIVLPNDLLKEWPGEAIRWALLSAHYRQPLEWTEELLKQSKKQLDRFYRLLEEIPYTEETGAAPESVMLALEDDLNTPEAYAGLHELRDIASQMEGAAREKAIMRLRDAGRLLGFFDVAPAEWFKGASTGGPGEAEIEALIAERAAARKAKDFARSDRIRDDLAAQGVIIEDGPQGATWRRA